MNINMLRDTDDNVGFYAVGTPASGSTTGWGSILYRSVDGGATYLSLGGMPSPAVMGVAVSVIGSDPNNGRLVDEFNTVDVRLTYGTLASVTFDNFLNGMQMAVLGDEIILFREAELIADMTYRLRGFVRGYRGSESQIGVHTFGERFVLASSATLKRIIAETAEIGTTSLFKAVTVGQQLGAATAKAFTFDGKSLMPYAPCQLGGGRVADDITINWVRRNRTNGEWRSSVDVPMTEATEAYEVDIYTDNTYTTVVRTISASSETATYTAAQQVADFGSAQATIYFKVYQLSTIVGRGYAATGSV